MKWMHILEIYIEMATKPHVGKFISHLTLTNWRSENISRKYAILYTQAYEKSFVYPTYFWLCIVRDFH